MTGAVLRPPGVVATFYGATADRYIFAFETFAGLDRLEMSHLFGDFGTDLLHLLVNEVAQCGGNGGND